MRRLVYSLLYWMAICFQQAGGLLVIITPFRVFELSSTTSTIAQRVPCIEQDPIRASSWALKDPMVMKNFTILFRRIRYESLQLSDVK